MLKILRTAKIEGKHILATLTDNMVRVEALGKSNMVENTPAVVREYVSELAGELLQLRAEIDRMYPTMTEKIPIQLKEEMKEEIPFPPLSEEHRMELRPAAKDSNQAISCARKMFNSIHPNMKLVEPKVRRVGEPNFKGEYTYIVWGQIVPRKYAFHSKVYKKAKKSQPPEVAENVDSIPSTSDTSDVPDAAK